MAWLIINPIGFDNSNSTPWHITETQSITIPPLREMAVHGFMLLEGQLIIRDTGRLRINQ